MASKDFDIEQLASYLHLHAEQVAKLAERGKIPGRKVGGQWRFSESEIHHWLEEKIGVSDEQQLGEVQKWIDRMPADPHFSDRFETLIPIDSIAVPLPSRTRGSVIRDMCELAAQSGYLWDPPAMADAVQDRENLHPTALENGVALLHPRRPQSSILGDSVVALGITPTPIPFGNRHGKSTDIFFLICSQNDRVHLQILAKLSRLLHDANLVEQLRHSSSAQEVKNILLEAERTWETTP